MSHYKSNLRDLEFNLFEFLNVQKAMGTGPYVNVDEDQARMLLAEINRFASDSIWADSFVPADRIPLELTDGDITLPTELREALEAYYDAGWHLMPLPEHLGGVGVPPTIRWAASEIMFGGHATAALWPIGPLFGGILDGLGTEGQRERFVPGMVNDRWGATMVLTEPDAGSDVGAGVTRAVKVEENGPDDLGSLWHIEGVKRFITSADADIHPNTVHLVLARPEGGKPGTKGLRLFIVPKFLVNEDGSLGDRNGVMVTNVEKKMGIKGSATCELTMGGDPDLPCIGYLVGEADEDGSGIAQMFRVIEYARMTVGTKAMATLSTGYLNALEYAKVREQGPDMTDMGNKVDKVTIINHPDVRRILMEQKAHVEGMRALVMYTGWVQDQAELAGDDEEAHTDWLAREDLLLPLVKGYCSEKAYELLALSLQTFGGSGFTQDYPIEQYIRDAKIDTLYEGTTAIQGLDLLFRKIVKDQGATLTWFAEQAKEVVKGGGANDPFVAEREMLGTALDDVQAHLGVLIGHAMKSLEDGHRTEIYKAGLNSTEFLYSLAEVLIGWMLLAHAVIAHEAIDAGSDEEFYLGKVASARWFARNVLPKVAMRRGLAEGQDGALMDVPEGAF